jgi:hypothetical protein
VVIAQSKDEAQRIAEEMLAGKMLGDAGNRVSCWKNAWWAKSCHSW